VADPRFKELAYDALAATLGAPVDLFATALRPLGYRDQPVLGSRFIRERLPQQNIPAPQQAFRQATMPVALGEVPQVDEMGRVIRQAPTPERQYTPLERIVGGAETAEAVLRGAVGMPVAAVGSLAQGVMEGDIRGERFGERMSSILQNLGYTPKTEAGQEMLGDVGQFMQRLETEGKFPPIGGAPTAIPLLGSARGTVTQARTAVSDELATPPRGAIGPIDEARQATRSQNIVSPADEYRSLQIKINELNSKIKSGDFSRKDTNEYSEALKRFQELDAELYPRNQPIIENQAIEGLSYAGQHSAPMKDSGAPLWKLDDVYPEDFYSLMGARYYGDGAEPNRDQRVVNLMQSFKSRPNGQITIYRAVPKDVKDGINVGDWVTIDRQYAKEHGESALNGEYRIIKKIVRARDIFTNGDSIYEFGYDPQPMVKKQK
jgi:hypothetical protein